MKLTNWLPFGKVPEISASELAKELDSWKIVDVRTVSEFENGHIEGAVNLPITAFTDENVLGLQLAKDKRVIAICRSAHRSIPAVRKLKALGFNAYQLKGGMISWRDKGLPEKSNESEAV